MSINSEVRLSELPKVNIGRSIFSTTYKHKTSMNAGELIPFYCREILPGETVTLKTSIVARLQTLLTPIMDDVICDIGYYFVPNRIVDDHWKNIMGENDDGPWIQDKIEYTVPVIEYPHTAVVEPDESKGVRDGTK